MEEKIKVIFDDFFRYERDRFYVEEVELEKIAKKYKTPLYIYSHQYLIKQVNRFKNAFSVFPCLICYSVKANSNINLLRILKENGLGADVVSEGELRRALIAGFKSEKIVFAGVGKTESEIELGIKKGIFCFNVENEEEVCLIEKYARKYKRKVLFNLRLNLDLDIDTHHYIKTSKSETKFGIDLEKAKEIIKKSSQLKFAKLCGFHLHLGSQIKEVSFYIRALEIVEKFIKEVDYKPEIIDIGGGFGIPYSVDDKLEPIENFGREICSMVKKLKIKKLIVEPGRFIVGNTGILVTKILYIKKRKNRVFVIVDAGMNDLIRPTLYGSFHMIIPARKIDGKKLKCDVVGPICESGDFLGKNVLLPEKIKPGDFLVVGSCGAYSFSMSSNYNSRRRPAEVLVDRDKVTVIRKRESFSDLWKREIN